MYAKLLPRTKSPISPFSVPDSNQLHTCLKWPKLETQVGGPEPEPEQIFSKTANF